MTERARGQAGARQGEAARTVEIREEPLAPGIRLELPDRLLLAGSYVLLQVSVVATAVLVLHSLAGMAMPGCGAGSPCELAAASKWGKVPGLGWPVSIVGLAFFLAMLQAVFVGVLRGGVSVGLRWIARAGAAASVAFTVIAIANRLPCIYCLVTHGANIGFVAAMEVLAIRGRATSRPRGMALGTFGVVFLVTLAALAGYWGATKAERDLRAEKERAASGQQIAEKIERDRSNAGAAGRGTKPPMSAGKPFTGRYRLGPEKAPIRIVIYSDYQCQDCKLIEGQVRRVMGARTDVSVSAKHFPFCTDCNRFAPNLHKNACTAARAAEAAGILGGDGAFWKMHQWLFDHNGLFLNDGDLRPGVAAAGLEFEALVRVMNSDETLRRVKEDVEEANSLGMFRSPMIFINGVEMKGWVAGQSVVRTVEELATKNPPPPPLGAENDHPPSAVEKVTADWRDNPRLPVPARMRSWARGPADAALRVVLFADYQFAQTVEADALVRAALAKHPAGVWRYEIRHFPFSKECNPAVAANHPAEKPLACKAARAAEAAGMLGGVEAFWTMHDWLLANRERLSDASLRGAAGSMGLDGEALLRTMNDPAVAAAIAADLAAAAAVQVSGTPIFVINDRQVRLWKMDSGEPVLEIMVGEAAAGK